MNTIKSLLRNFLFFTLFFSGTILCAQETLTFESVKGVYDLSESRYEAGDYKRAIEYGEKGLGQAKEIGDDQLILFFQSVLGSSHLEIKEYKESVNYFLQIGLKAEQLNNSGTAGDAYFAIANVYATMKAYNKSADTYK